MVLTVMSPDCATGSLRSIPWARHQRVYLESRPLSSDSPTRISSAFRLLTVCQSGKSLQLNQANVFNQFKFLPRFFLRWRRLDVCDTRSSHWGEFWLPFWTIFEILLWPSELDQCTSKSWCGKFIRIPGKLFEYLLMRYLSLVLCDLLSSVSVVIWMTLT